MNQSRQSGELNVLLLPMIIVGVLMLGALGFGVWAYGERQDYKDNVDGKIAEAVTVNEQKVKVEQKAFFDEEEKKPLKKYVGPSQYRAVTLEYPKTWSGYVDSTGGSPVDVYFHPNVVPRVQGNDTAYALRMQVVERSYDSVVATFKSDIKNGKVKATPYKLAAVSSVQGIRMDGEIETKRQGSMVIFPINDKTLKIWTESPDFLNDFNNNVLPTASFNP